MSRALLVLPDRRPEFEGVIDGHNLALSHFLGKPLIEHCFEGLASAGVTEVRVLACDRPAEIRSYADAHRASGLSVDVIAEEAELDEEAARKRHASFRADSFHTLEALPQAPDVPVIASVADWHAARRALLARLLPGQVGVREVRPGIWAGSRARIAESATLVAPCWIGASGGVRPHAVVGPDAYVEADCIVDRQATVENSTVSRSTYLGEMTHLRESVASGSHLVNWKSGSALEVRDSFLLSPLHEEEHSAPPVAGRVTALAAMVLTSPLLLLAALLSGLRRTPFWERLEATLPAAPGARPQVVVYREFAGPRAGWRRWPRLWRIVTGHFAWTGNPPLAPAEAAALESEFELLWLDIAPGLFTAPEAEGCRPPWDDEARAHAAVFACRPTFAWRWKILRRGLAGILLTDPSLPTPSPDPQP